MGPLVAALRCARSVLASLTGSGCDGAHVLGYLFSGFGTRVRRPSPSKCRAQYFRYPRVEHSANPAEIRDAIEHRYPHYEEGPRRDSLRRQHQGYKTNG